VDLAALIRSGDRRALARALTLAEQGDPAAAALVAAGRETGRFPRRAVVTGPPGAGKSTLIGAILGQARARGLAVAVLAVDPSSPFTGGALLGDRIRMAGSDASDRVFIRSQASRGASGGLAPTTPDLLDVLDLGGFDLVVLETVGAGQADLDGVRATDFAVVVLSPQTGDSVQAMKAGLIEAADLVVVNKSDLPGAEAARDDLLGAFELSSRGTKPVLLCSAQNGGGVEALLDAILAFPQAELAARRARRQGSRA
jgi:LAO/AO transport system kinase